MSEGKELIKETTEYLDLETENQRLRAFIDALVWRDSLTHENVQFCYICGMIRGQGHKGHCVAKEME